MGRSRHDQANPINAADNRLLCCKTCHDRFARVVLATRIALAAEWRAHFEYAPGHGARRTGR